MTLPSQAVSSAFLILSISLCFSASAEAQVEQDGEGSVIDIARPDAAADGAGEGPGYDPELDEAARLTFVRAREAFDAGQYEDALRRFRQAYELSPRPTLLYNIAASLDRLRRDEEAADALRAYLDALPDAPDRVEVEARLRVLDATIAQRRERDTQEQRAADEEARRIAEAEAASANDTPADSRSGLHPAIAIGVGGAAVLSGALIIWSGLNASGRNDDYVAYATGSGANYDVAKAMYDNTRSAERRTNALIGVSLGLAAASAVLFVFTDFGGDEDQVAIGASPIEGGGLVSAGGSF